MTTTAATGTPPHPGASSAGAAKMAGVDQVFRSTMNRDHIRRLMEQRSEEVADAMDEERLGGSNDIRHTRGAHHTHAVDVGDFVDRSAVDDRTAARSGDVLPKMPEDAFGSRSAPSGTSPSIRYERRCAPVPTCSPTPDGRDHGGMDAHVCPTAVFGSAVGFPAVASGRLPWRCWSPRRAG